MPLSVRPATTTVGLPGAQQGLANAIRASRVAVNRALRRLTAEGIIRVEPGAVTILAPELLAQRVCDDTRVIRCSECRQSLGMAETDSA